jgi:hypothetical protein
MPQGLSRTLSAEAKTTFGYVQSMDQVDREVSSGGCQKAQKEESRYAGWQVDFLNAAFHGCQEDMICFANQLEGWKHPLVLATLDSLKPLSYESGLINVLLFKSLLTLVLIPLILSPF